MKKIILFYFILLAISSCVNVNLSRSRLTDQIKSFDSFLFLYSNEDGNFEEWNEESFNQILKSSFNGSEQESKRETFSYYLRKHLKDKKIYSADQVFTGKSTVDYADFMATIEHIKFDGILLIHDKGNLRKDQVSMETRSSKSYTAYQIFLIDKLNYKYSWVGDFEAEANEMQEVPKIYQQVVKELVSKLDQNGFLK
ncbi:hypothetical protein ACFOUP_13810 [Belliella kenyensis]|uniref:Lipoprotein n=1 Tax=Belliella kenyensis TaxID=1472724 RepID=A0ABV8EP41_9BACT|nr:hypothetical protein [Belliella kenyensis]MCH7401518.1 hypothetical protein [Belliella kenyensis]MDN3603201.1 hypothetical protein [Belliella kenyensis]